MNSIQTDQFNDKLAAACQACAAACCKKGKIFLPPQESAAIEAWIQRNNPAELAEFQMRQTAHDGFSLYDQQECCQFLDERNLCRLHTDGVKPAECFWWPFHVYATEDQSLEVRLSTSCCDGYRYLSPATSHPFIEKIIAQARQIGLGLIRRFRRVYAGSYEAIPVAKIKE